MRLGEIYTLLDGISPFATQASWDNSGLILGDLNDRIEQVYVSLDVESALLQEVEEHSLIITHHPLIFKGLKTLNFARYPTNLLKTCIEKKIALIAMHTHFDLSHLNHYVAERLGFGVLETKGYVSYMQVNMDFESLCLHVKEILEIPLLRCVKAAPWVGRCALTTGSGGDMLHEVEAECFITGDLKYHQALEAKENGLSLLDVGHFESERYFAACLAEHLKILPLKVIMSNSKNPFEYR